MDPQGTRVGLGSCESGTTLGEIDISQPQNQKKEDQEDYDEGEGKTGGGGEGEGGEEKEESLRKKRLNTMRAYQLVTIRLLDATG